MSSNCNKNIYIITLLTLCGIVLGGFIGNYIGSFPNFSWLNFGEIFGTSDPIIINLIMLELIIGIKFTINIGSVMGILISTYI